MAAASNQKIPSQRVSSRVMKTMPRARSPPLAPYNMIASYAHAGLPSRKAGAGNERTMRAAPRHLHDHLGPGVALFQIGDCCGDLGKPVAPVDLRAHFAGLDQLRQQLQVAGGDVRLDHDIDDSLVVGSPGPGRANYPTSRRIVRTTPAASGTATQKTIENEICGT
jgi:hypothetical protein